MINQQSSFSWNIYVKQSEVYSTSPFILAFVLNAIQIEH